jgi:hypothetical protein
MRSDSKTLAVSIVRDNLNQLSKNEALMRMRMKKLKFIPFQARPAARTAACSPPFLSTPRPRAVL